VSERLVDAAAIADLLGVPTSWVREQTRAGAIPHVRLGRYVRFDEDAVRAWVAECSRPGRPIVLRRYEPARRNG
jgi:excisionase family DNA binding protein